MPENISPDAVAIPITTAEEDRHSAGQRGINRIWELTQSTIAIAITIATIVICFILVWRGDIRECLILISNAFFLIVGFYFGRTNHTKVGGVQLPYLGR